MYMQCKQLPDIFSTAKQQNMYVWSTLPPQVSSDGELKLYEACINAGITLLSIAHRPTLKRFHQLVVHIDGTVSTTGKGWWTEVRSWT